MGLRFATWESRILDIKTNLQLSEVEFGAILLALPMKQLVIMPFSGKLLTCLDYLSSFGFLLYLRFQKLRQSNDYFLTN